MNPSINLFQPKITLGSFGVDSIPAKDWREMIAKGTDVKYRCEVRGTAKVAMLDGTMTLASVQAVIFDGRTPSIHGVVEAYQYREAPDGGLFTDVRVNDKGELEFSADERGAFLKAQLVKGKTLSFTDAELSPVIDKQTNLQVLSAGKPVFEIRHHEGIACVDRPAFEQSTGAAAPIVATGVAQGPRSAGRSVQKTVQADVTVL
jgi:hypothetical protein